MEKLKAILFQKSKSWIEFNLEQLAKQRIKENGEITIQACEKAYKQINNFALNNAQLESFWTKF